jgi:hypothetical protein
MRLKLSIIDSPDVAPQHLAGFGSQHSFERAFRVFKQVTTFGRLKLVFDLASDGVADGRQVFDVERSEQGRDHGGKDVKHPSGFGATRAELRQ